MTSIAFPNGLPFAFGWPAPVYMPPGDKPLRGGDTPPRGEQQSQKPDAARQIITFVDSQDPKSRSAIQRHTANHSNAQRRHDRLQSLRTNRPRVLEWQRRPSTEPDMSVTSPPTSTSSASVSPAPGLRHTFPAASDRLTELMGPEGLPDPQQTSRKRSQLANQPQSADLDVSRRLVTAYLNRLCPHASRDAVYRITDYIRGRDICCSALLKAYLLACLGPDPSHEPTEPTPSSAHQYYGVGTRLLRDRLTNPKTASSDDNIQAVLLLIAYASDTEAEEEELIHIDALERMIRQRGGLQKLREEVDEVLSIQLESISESRKGHLTLSCKDECSDSLRSTCEKIKKAVLGKED